MPDEDTLSKIFVMLQDEMGKPKKKTKYKSKKTPEQRRLMLERLARGRQTALKNRLAKKKLKENIKMEVEKKPPTKTVKKEEAKPTDPTPPEVVEVKITPPPETINPKSPEAEVEVDVVDQKPSKKVRRAKPKKKKPKVVPKRIVAVKGRWY